MQACLCTIITVDSPAWRDSSLVQDVFLLSPQLLISQALTGHHRLESMGLGLTPGDCLPQLLLTVQP